MKKLTTGEAIAKSLVAHGTDTVFGIPGAHMYDFNDALAREGDKIRFVTTRHEQGAGYMAFGYAKSTGKTGVFSVVPGPGVLNASAAMCTANGANTPMVCVTGNIMSHLIGRGRGQLHELPDQLATLNSFIKWAGRIDHPSQAPGIVAEAFAKAQGGRPGPTALEAPWDVMGQAGPVDLDLDRTVPLPPEPDEDAIARAAALIVEAKNPLIIVGAGAYGASEEVLELAQLLQAPVTAHRSGKGVVSNNSPYGLLSSAAWPIWEHCDCVIGIGSRLELLHFRWQTAPADYKTIRIDIDPTEMVRLAPDVGVVSDARAGTRALIEAVDKTIGRRASRVAEFEALKAQSVITTAHIQPQIGYLEAIRAALPEDGFFVEEVSQVGFTARFTFPVYAPRQYVTCGYQDNLGFGFHTALGVKVANPDKAVVSVCGDGGFMFGVQELATAVQYNINLVTVIFNNSAFGNVRRDQTERFGGRLLGADLVNPDFVKLAESFGAVGRRVETPQKLEKALSEACKETGPVIIEVPVERGSEVSPWPHYHPAR